MADFRMIHLTVAMLVLSFSAVADAEPAKAKQTGRATKTRVQKLCYISGSASPQPCERMHGFAPTTTIPIVVIRYR